MKIAILVLVMTLSFAAKLKAAPRNPPPGPCNDWFGRNSQDCHVCVDEVKNDLPEDLDPQVFCVAAIAVPDTCWEYFEPEDEEDEEAIENLIACSLCAHEVIEERDELEWAGE